MAISEIKLAVISVFHQIEPNCKEAAARKTADERTVFLCFKNFSCSIRDSCLRHRWQDQLLTIPEHFINYQCVLSLQWSTTSKGKSFDQQQWVTISSILDSATKVKKDQYEKWLVLPLIFCI